MDELIFVIKEQVIGNGKDGGQCAGKLAFLAHWPPSTSSTGTRKGIP